MLARLHFATIEGNLNLTLSFLDHPAFTGKIGPQGELPTALAEHVQPLFSTDFARERWVIQEGKSGAKRSRSAVSPASNSSSSSQIGS
jgi:hypothetical protein